MVTSDIHEDMGARLPLPRREELPDDAKALFDYFANPKSGSYVGLKGPGGLRLHSPPVALAMQPLNHYLRRDSGIPRPVRELSILVVARELDSQFEWTAHEPEALKEGISREVVDIVKHRRPADHLPETEAVVIALGREIFRDHRVTPEIYARALALFGRRMLVDLVSVMGNYAATAALLCAFDMQVHAGTEPLLPMA
jgi:4-carboxymuconolactone decarboxylase